MDAIHPLTIESFSYSWLVNIKPSIDDLSCEEANFMEMDPKLSSSKRFFENSQSQSFNFPMYNSSRAFIYADELISNGFLVPLFIKPLKKERIDSMVFESERKVSNPNTEEKIILTSKSRYLSLRRCGKLSKEFLRKNLSFIRPLCRKLQGRRSSSRIEVVDERDRRNETLVYSNYSSPRTSGSYYDDSFHSSCDSESSIYEAVLHCKNSIGK